MKSAFRKDVLCTIKKSMGRFVAIIGIVMLGAGFYAGLRVTAPDMRQTIDHYMDDYRMMDIHVVSSLGLTDADAEAVRKVEGVKNVMPAHFLDAPVTVNEQDSVIRVHSLPEQAEESNDSYLNRVEIKAGRLPQAANECVMMKNAFGGEEMIGKTVTLRNVDEDILTEQTYTVVGLIETPYYVSHQLGSTSMGNGTLNGYLYIPESNFKTDFYTELYVEVEGAAKLSAFSDAYDELVNRVQERIESISGKQLEVRRDEVLGDAAEQLEQAKKEFEDGKAEAETKFAEAEQELDDAEAEIAAQRAALQAAKKQIEEGKITIETARAELAAGRTALELGKKQLEEGRKAYEEGLLAFNTGKAEMESAFEEAETQLTLGKAQLLLQQMQMSQALTEKENADALVAQKKTQLAELEAQLKEADEATAALLQAAVLIRRQELETAQQTAKSAQSKYDTAQTEYNTLSAQITAGEKELNAQKVKAETELQLAERKLDDTYAMLAANEAKVLESEQELLAGEQQLTLQAKTLEETEQQIKDGEQELLDAEKEVENGRAELAEKRAESEQQLADAEQEIADAEAQIGEAENASWYVLDRHSNVGFVNFEGDCNRMDSLSTTLPLIFFMVAALVALTTMTRMVEEERTLIGTYCALGYNRRSIAAKYLIYAGTATLTGSLIGILMMQKLLPMIIWACYQILYHGPAIETPYSLKFSLIGTVVSCACTVGAAFLVCRRSVQERPARLLQPRAPRAGKRILLERVPFVWERLSFLGKITARNIFRYKKRLFMTVVGIAGCTGLLVTGFGIRDSVSQLISNQFEDLYQFHIQTTIEGELPEETLAFIDGRSEIKDMLYVYKTAQDITDNDHTVSAYILVPESNTKFAEFVKLQDRNTKETVEFGKNAVVVTEKLAKLLDLSVGDKVKIEKPDGTPAALTVTGITEHYMMHYIYVAPDVYRRLVGEPGAWNELDMIGDPNAEVDYGALCDELLTQEGINTAISTVGLGSQLDTMINSLNYVVLVVIVCAGLLAFIVLYNLTNINISERQREIATVRVLGFRNLETAMYIYREAIILTLLGALGGLLFGTVLHNYVITTIEVDMVMFSRSVQPLSYVWAMLITGVFSFIVNLVMYRKIIGVSMVESLKSVD